MMAYRFVYGMTLVGLVMVLGGCASATPTPTATPPPSPTPSPRPEGEYGGTITLPGGQNMRITAKYIVDLPPGYDPGSGVKYPLQVYLHGAGATGIPIEDFRSIARPPALAAASTRFPLIILYPQLPSRDLTWKLMVKPLNDLLDQVVKNYPVDTDRIYLTGYSDGGYGALAFGSAYPERFAAIAEVAGYYDDDIQQICGLKDKPLLVYHDQNDQVIPLGAERAIEKALQSCGGKPLVTIYKDTEVTHFTIADRVFGQLDLYTELFKHSLSGQ